MNPEFLIIHDTDSPYGNPFVVNHWHKERGFKNVVQSTGTVLNCGYHWLILNGYLYGTDASDYDENSDGQAIACRPEDMVGAHASAKGMNGKSLGIALVGVGPDPNMKFTPKQIGTLHQLIHKKRMRYTIPLHQVLGHKEVDNQRSDPRFDMGYFRAVQRDIHP